MQWDQKEKNKFPPFSLHINKKLVGVLLSSFPVCDARSSTCSSTLTKQIKHFWFSSHQIWWTIQTGFRQKASTLQTTSKNPKNSRCSPSSVPLSDLRRQLQLTVYSLKTRVHVSTCLLVIHSPLPHFALPIIHLFLMFAGLSCAAVSMWLPTCYPEFRFSIEQLWYCWVVYLWRAVEEESVADVCLCTSVHQGQPVGYKDKKDDITFVIMHY